MKKPLIIVGLCILGLFFASFDFQNSDAGVAQYLKKIERYLGASFSAVETDLGVPDDKTSDSNVMIYHVKDKSGKVTGYRLFGMWGEGVGCFCEKNILAQDQAMSLYQQVMAFMQEDGRTVGMVAGDDMSSEFTDNHKVSRRLDNMWELDMRLRDLASSINFFVYEHDNRGCYKELLLEARRVEEALGI